MKIHFWDFCCFNFRDFESCKKRTNRIKMLLSILVYGSMLLIMTFCGYKVACSEDGIASLRGFCANKYIICAISTFCIVAALRWRVGMDCNSYIRIFYHSHMQLETGFELLIKVIKNFGGTHVLFFFTLALLESFFFYYAFKWNKESYLFIPIILFASGEFFMLMNGVRQSIACCVFVYISTIIKEKRWECLFLVFLCGFMHRSAWILLPVVGGLFFLRKDIWINKYLQMLIVIIAFLGASNNVLEVLDPLITKGLNLLGYHSSEKDLLSLSLQRTMGPRAYIDLTIYLLIICFSDKMKTMLDIEKYSVQYLLFFIGVVGGYLFYDVHAMSRLFMYFNIFKIVMMVYFMQYLFLDKPLNISKYYVRILVVLLLMTRVFVEFYADNNPARETTYYKFYFDNLKK